MLNIQRHNENELTEEEKKELKDLPNKFNVVKKSSNIDFVASKRTEISKRVAKNLLMLSFLFNVLSIGLVILTILINLAKPYPSYYASTPSGQVYGPLQTYSK
jgi:type IV secretory pathway component VirB8